MKIAKRNSNSPVTLIDVAKHAGVSPMTVSRVLNNFPKVRKSTKEKVLASVSELNYLPNQAARNLVSGRARRICLLYANPSSAYLEKLMLGALEALGSYGYQLIVKNVSQDIAAEQLKDLLTNAWDGVIIPPPISDMVGIRKMLIEAQMPAVFLGSMAGTREAFEIGINDFQASSEMTKYLISLGHSRIGFVQGHPSHSTSSAREDGYKNALQDAGIEIEAMLLAQGYFTYKSGLEAGLKLLKVEHPPTAIFASNDDMAAGVLGAAASLGLRVPNDISIVGFDDSPIATTIWPNLTTVGQPLVEMAGKAVEILHHELEAEQENSPPKKPVFLQHVLIERDSTSVIQNDMKQID